MQAAHQLFGLLQRRAYTDVTCPFPHRIKIAESEENQRLARIFFCYFDRGKQKRKLSTNGSHELCLQLGRVAVHGPSHRPQNVLRGSEVNDDIRRADDREVLVRRDTQICVAIEGESVQRPVIGNLRPNLDLGRESVLPADAGLDVPRLGAGALPLHVVNKFRAIGDVVQRRHLVVHVRQERLKRSGAADQRSGFANREAGRIERHILRRERSASIRPESVRSRNSGTRQTGA